ncbi:unnamed protein product [Amoebophrya sp. A25]|nr:unnamed protein product [Amoebophrya sp. A25]|eukprot:GSA25T00022949001.1
MYKSHPELFACEPTDDFASLVPYPFSNLALNPLDDRVYDFLSVLFARVAKIFDVDGGLLERDIEDNDLASSSIRSTPKFLFHTGSDEVPTGCWKRLVGQEYPKTEFEDYSTRKVRSTVEMFDYFTARVASILEKQNRRPMYWDEAVNHQNTKVSLQNPVVQVWNGGRSAVPILERGFDVVLSSSDVWYLDHLDTRFEDIYRGPKEIFGGHAEDEAGEGVGKILGGEAPMWTERVDGSNLFVKVLPNLALVAERLWSPLEKTRDYSAARPRLQFLRCFLADFFDGPSLVSLPLEGAVSQHALGGRSTGPPGPGSCFQMPELEEQAAVRTKTLAQAFEEFHGGKGYVAPSTEGRGVDNSIGGAHGGDKHETDQQGQLYVASVLPVLSRDRRSDTPPGTISAASSSSTTRGTSAGTAESGTSGEQVGFFTGWTLLQRIQFYLSIAATVFVAALFGFLIGRYTSVFGRASVLALKRGGQQHQQLLVAQGGTTSGNAVYSSRSSSNARGILMQQFLDQDVGDASCLRDDLEADERGALFQRPRSDFDGGGAGENPYIFYDHDNYGSKRSRII